MVVMVVVNKYISQKIGRRKMKNKILNELIKGVGLGLLLSVPAIILLNVLSKNMTELLVASSFILVVLCILMVLLVTDKNEIKK